jgi:predicted DCC family thiol-disulfide oxidoreductase YuxK
MRSPDFVPVDRGFWTGGQYSLSRALTGVGLSAAALVLAIRETVPGARVPMIGVTPAALVAALAALVWAAGIGDRIAAVMLLATGTGIVLVGPFPSGRAAILLAAILAAHLLIPPAPYGSIAARGRPDPAGGWRMPRIVWLGLWLALAAAYAQRSMARLGKPEWTGGSALARALGGDAGRYLLVREHLWVLPPELLQAVTWGVLAAGIAFVPALFFPRLRAWAWIVLGTVQIGRLALLHTAGDAAALLAVHLFTFDPGWVPGRRAAGGAPETLFYDGTCGLCHRAVRFVVAEDPGGRAFRFAPLQGGLYHAAIDDAARAALPDSLIVLTADGRVLTRSRAVRHLLIRLGGLWGVLARLAVVIPAPLGDAAYDVVAGLRHRLFARPPEACPILPRRLRSRFVLDEVQDAVLPRPR